MTVDTATLTVKGQRQSIAPPFDVVVLRSGNPLILNENSNALAIVDTSTLTSVSRFPVGDGLDWTGNQTIFGCIGANLVDPSAVIRPYPCATGGLVSRGI